MAMERSIPSTLHFDSNSTSTFSLKSHRHGHSTLRACSHAATTGRAHVRSRQNVNDLRGGLGFQKLVHASGQQVGRSPTEPKPRPEQHGTTQITATRGELGALVPEDRAKRKLRTLNTGIPHGATHFMVAGKMVAFK